MWNYTLRREDHIWWLIVLSAPFKVRERWVIHRSEKRDPLEILNPLMMRKHIGLIHPEMDGTRLSFEEYKALATSEEEEDLEMLARVIWSFDSDHDPLTVSRFGSILQGQSTRLKPLADHQRYTKPTSKKFTLSSWEYQS